MKTQKAVISLISKVNPSFDISALESHEQMSATTARQLYGEVLGWGDKKLSLLAVSPFSSSTMWESKHYELLQLLQSVFYDPFDKIKEVKKRSLRIKKNNRRKKSRRESFLSNTPFPTRKELIESVGALFEGDTSQLIKDLSGVGNRKLFSLYTIISQKKVGFRPLQNILFVFTMRFDHIDRDLKGMRLVKNMIFDTPRLFFFTDHTSYDRYIKENL